MDSSNVIIEAKSACLDCGTLVPIGRGRPRKYCKKCSVKRSNTGRKKYNELTDFEKLKLNTRRQSRALVDSEFIKKKPCDVCGNPKSEIHHDNYHDAWNFRWMCKKCHTQYHKMLKLIPSLDTTKIYKTG